MREWVSKAIVSALCALALTGCGGDATGTPAPTAPPLISPLDSPPAEPGPELAPMGPKAIFVENPIVPPDVPMVDQDERPAKLSDFRGRYIFVTIANVKCEDACVDALPVFMQVKGMLGERNDVAYMMIGTDIKADSPAALKSHLSKFDPAFIGLTAERQPMRELAVRFGIHTYIRGDGALAPHAPFTYLVDTQGRLLYFFQDGLSAQQIVDAVKKVIR